METEKPSTWGHRVETQQDVGPTSDRQDRHGILREKTDREWTVDPEHEDTDYNSDHTRWVIPFYTSKQTS